MRNFILLFFLAPFFFSCQTEIEVKIPNYYNKLVIEGYLENGEFPVVSLYRSAPYFSTMSLDYLIDSIIIRDARVFVKPENGEEQELFINHHFLPRWDYPLLYAYSTRNMVGELNTKYSLRVEWNNKIYTSETQILDTFELDSVGFVPNFGHPSIDSTANIRISMTDNGLMNYYQFKVKIHCAQFQDRLWIPTIPTTFDNSPFKGKTFNYEIMRGSPSSIFIPEMTERERRFYFRMNYRVGDTVFFKYARIDYDSFRFWNTAGDEIGFGQNPFMSPQPIISNIKCNTGEKCLGVWCGAAKKEVVMIFDSASTTLIKKHY